MNQLELFEKLKNLTVANVEQLDADLMYIEEIVQSYTY